MVFILALAALLAADSQGFGPEKLCNLAGGKYNGVSYVGGTKEGTAPAKVPYCTAGPSTLLEPHIAPLID